MGKDTFYFSHDYNAFNDPKLTNIHMKLGLEGIGLYWCVVELLYQENGYLQIEDIESLAFRYRTNTSVFNSLIQIAFNSDEEKFWSNSVLERLSFRKLKSEQARINAQKRWNKQEDDIPEEDEQEETQPEEKITKEQVEEFSELYNSICENLPKVIKLSAVRKKKIKVRLNQEPNLETWKKVFKKVNDSDFCCKGGWCNIDWLITNDNNYLKVLEGKYDNKIKGSGVNKPKNSVNDLNRLERG